MHPNFTKSIMLQTDVSDVGLRAVLSQDVDREEHPILYFSQKLFP